MGVLALQGLWLSLQAPQSCGIALNFLFRNSRSVGSVGLLYCASVGQGANVGIFSNYHSEIGDLAPVIGTKAKILVFTGLVDVWWDSQTQEIGISSKFFIQCSLKSLHVSLSSVPS